MFEQYQERFEVVGQLGNAIHYKGSNGSNLINGNPCEQWQVAELAFKNSGFDVELVATDGPYSIWKLTGSNGHLFRVGKTGHFGWPAEQTIEAKNEKTAREALFTLKMRDLV